MPVASISGQIGLDGLFRLSDPSAAALRAVKGSRLNDSSFRVESRSVLEGIVSTLTLTFRGSEIDLDFEDNRGLRGRLQGVASD